jgi:hypothetical protein
VGVIDTVGAAADNECQLLDAVEAHICRLRRVAAVQKGTLPEQVPVTEHLELRVAPARTDFVIHAHLGGEFVRIPVNVYDPLAVGVRAQTVRKGLSANGKRVILHGFVRVRPAPILLHLAHVELTQRERLFGANRGCDQTEHDDQSEGFKTSIGKICFHTCFA